MQCSGVARVACVALVVALQGLGQSALAGTFVCDAASTKSLRERLLGGDERLASVVISADVAHASVCSGVDAQLDAAVGQSASGAYRVITERLCEIEAWGDPRLQGAAKSYCEGDRECSIELLLRGSLPERRRDSTCPYALSGGMPFAAFLGHLGSAGHFEVTRKALAEASARSPRPYSSAAASILQDASRDADLFDWELPAAHAQEASDPSGDLPAKRDGGERFIAWTQCGLQAAREACAAGRPRSALYLLGYALHGVQDLVFHAGISNAEHSYRDVHEEAGIDFRERYTEKIALATRATVGVLQAFGEQLARSGPVQSACWSSMQTWSGSGALSSDEKQAILGPRDFGIAAYRRYRLLADIVKDRFQAGERRSKVILEPRWLQDLSPQAIDTWVRRIESGLVAGTGEPKACRRMEWQKASQ